MPAKPIDNERRACDAVAQVLEERRGSMRANSTSPEDERVGPPIEYIVRPSMAGPMPSNTPSSKPAKAAKSTSL